MRSPGSAKELEMRRRIAASMLSQGKEAREVADFLVYPEGYGLERRLENGVLAQGALPEGGSSSWTKGG